MATIDLGKIKLVWRGTYNNGTAYAVDDVVGYTDSGITSSYICTTASTGNAPSSSGTVHGSWAYLAKGATAYTSTLTTQGDILYRDGSGEARLAKGTAGQVLTMNSGATAPEWAAATGGLDYNGGGGGTQNVWYNMTSTQSMVSSNSWTETITLTLPTLSTATRFFVSFSEDRREQDWSITTGQYQQSDDNGSSWGTLAETSQWWRKSIVGSDIGTNGIGDNFYHAPSNCYLLSYASGDTPKFRMRGIKWGNSNNYRSGGQKGFHGIFAFKVDN